MILTFQLLYYFLYYLKLTSCYDRLFFANFKLYSTKNTRSNLFFTLINYNEKPTFGMRIILKINRHILSWFKNHINLGSEIRCVSTLCIFNLNYEEALCQN